jgi:hypothetical protein
METKPGVKSECKLCNEMFHKGQVDVCGKCHVEYLNRRDLLDKLEVNKSKKYAVKLYEDHMNTMGDNPDREWFEKKRLLASNILKYEDNKVFL